MTDPAPADGGARDRGLFDGWSDYAAIVASDLLRHRAIFRALGSWVRLVRPGPFALADLGCGDAGLVIPTFTDTGLWSYTGVDTSPRALDAARGHLAGARFATRLVAADMLDWLRDAAGSAGTTSPDVVLSVYAVHHLPTEAKREFFARTFAILPPGGALLYGDLFRRGDESRAAWLDAFVASLRAEWLGMSDAALASTISHVTANDHPETPADLAAIATEAGFAAAPRDLFADPSGFHRLMCFTKPAAVGPTLKE